MLASLSSVALNASPKASARHSCRQPEQARPSCGNTLGVSQSGRENGTRPSAHCCTPAGSKVLQGLVAIIPTCTLSRSKACFLGSVGQHRGLNIAVDPPQGHARFAKARQEHLLKHLLHKAVRPVRLRQRRCPRRKQILGILGRVGRCPEHPAAKVARLRVKLPRPQRKHRRIKEKVFYRPWTPCLGSGYVSRLSLFEAPPRAQNAARDRVDPAQTEGQAQSAAHGGHAKQALHGLELAREPRPEHVVDAKVVLVLVCRRTDGVGRHSHCSSNGRGSAGAATGTGRAGRHPLVVGSGPRKLACRDGRDLPKRTNADAVSGPALRSNRLAVPP